MNAIKFQHYLIESIANKGAAPYYEDDDNFYIVPQQDRFLMKLKKYKTIINIKEYGHRNTTLKKYLSIKMEMSITAIITNETEKISNNICSKFIDANNRELFINKSHLSYFESNNLEYRATQGYLFIYEFGELVGMICETYNPSKKAEE